MSTFSRLLRRAAVTLVCVPALVAASAAMPAAATTTPAPASLASCGQLLFHDGFGRADDPAWTFHNRSGEIRDGRLWVDGAYLNGAIGRDGWALTHAADRHWRDYSLTVTYNSTNVGGFPGEVHMAMLLFRTEKTGATGRDTTYLAMVWDPGQPDPRNGGATVLQHGLVQLFRYVNGVATVVAEATRSNTHVGVNHVTVTAVGAKIQVWANWQRVLSFVDPKPLRYGGVGVGQIWETNGWFDNVTVRRR